MAKVADSVRRKLAAKRFNENIKLFANTLNTAALTIFGTALILPAVNGAVVGNWAWIVGGMGLHLSAQAVLRILRSEE